jgi:hypothetical protein
MRLRQWALALAFVALISAPAAAQGTLGAGVTFFNSGTDGFSTGIGGAVDYSRVLRTTSGGINIGWALDVNFNHIGVDDDLADVFDLVDFDAGANVFTGQVGGRFSGRAGDRADWFGQLLFGVAHVGPSGDLADICEDLEDILDEGGVCSSNDLVITPEFGVHIRMNERTMFKAQIGFPMVDGDAATRFLLGVAWNIGQ